jgi:hypothetical protein
MESSPPRSRSFAGVAVALVLLLVALVPWIPFLSCPQCTTKRREIEDWLGVAYLTDYRNQHPEAVEAAKNELRLLDETCPVCFKGRINLLMRWGVLGRQRRETRSVNAQPP